MHVPQARRRRLPSTLLLIAATMSAASSMAYASRLTIPAPAPAPTVADVAVPVTTDPADQIAPKISGDRVVWQDARNGSWDIYVYDFVTGIEMAVGTGPAEQIMPAIGGDTVAWHEYPAGDYARHAPSEVVILSLVTGTSIRFDAGILDLDHRINAAVAVSPEWVVWGTKPPDPLNQRLQAHHLTTGVTTWVVSGSGPSQNRPSVSGNRAVWMGAGSPANIVTRDLTGGPASPVPTPGVWLNTPVIDGDRIVYWDSTFGDPTIGLRLHDLASGADQLIGGGNFTRGNAFADISGDRVVVSALGTYAQNVGIIDLATGDIKELVQPGYNYLAQISGDRMVWQDNRNGNWDVYALLIGPANSAPVAHAGVDQIVESTGPSGAAVTLNGAMSSDPDPGDPLTFTWTGDFPEGTPAGVVTGATPTVTLAQGTHVITLMVMDLLALSSTDEVTITVHDTTPPAIDDVSASPDELWPPDHKMRDVTVTVSASDLVDAAPVCQIASVSSNELVNGSGDGDTSPDWVITGSHTLQLRAERDGKGSGRIYTIDVECGDAAGNVSTATTTVTVPKSKGKQ